MEIRIYSERNVINLNRTKIVIASIILSLCIGSIYSWSIFLIPISELINLSLIETQYCFALTIFTLGCTASIGAKYIKQYGPMKSALIGTLCFSLGMILTAISLSLHSLLIYVTYGLILGIGVGIIYLIPIPLLLQVFPNNKALGSSISILAFGFGSAVFVPLSRLFPLVDSFLIYGLIYGILMLFASLLLPKDSPKTYKTISQTDSLTCKEAQKTSSFRYIFLIFFINIFVGISIISIAAPLCEELLLTDVLGIVAIIGICNGIGRPFWAYIADNLNYVMIYRILFIMQIISLMLIFNNINSAIALFVIASTYGGGFSCLPALTEYIFGPDNVQEILGKLLFAWALAGSLGPLCVTSLYTLTGTYLLMIPIFIVLLLIAFYVSQKITIKC